MKPEITFDRYAIFKTGGKQYAALEGKTIAVEKLEAAVGAQVVFDEVLLRKTGPESIVIGQPFVNTPVKASVVKHMREPKVVAFMFKRRKKVRRKQGHRQPKTIIRIESI